MKRPPRKPSGPPPGADARELARAEYEEAHRDYVAALDELHDLCVEVAADGGDPSDPGTEVYQLRILRGEVARARAERRRAAATCYAVEALIARKGGQA